MTSRFWQRYRQSPLLRDIVDKAAFFTKAAAAIYFVREHLIEFTVVGGQRQRGKGLRLRSAREAPLESRAAQRRAGRPQAHPRRQLT